MKKLLSTVMAGIAAAAMLASSAVPVSAIRYSQFNEVKDAAECADVEIVDSADDHVTMKQETYSETATARKIGINWDQMLTEENVRKVKKVTYTVTYTGLDAFNETQCVGVFGGGWSATEDEQGQLSDCWEIYRNGDSFDHEASANDQIIFENSCPALHGSLIVIDWSGSKIFDGEQVVGDLDFVAAGVSIKFSNFKFYDANGNELDQLAEFLEWDPKFSYDESTCTWTWEDPAVPWEKDLTTTGYGEYISYGMGVYDEDWQWATGAGTTSVYVLDSDGRRTGEIGPPRFCPPVDLTCEWIWRDKKEPIPTSGHISIVPQENWDADTLYFNKVIDYSGLDGIMKVREGWNTGYTYVQRNENDIAIRQLLSDDAVGYVTVVEWGNSDRVIWNTLAADIPDTDTTRDSWFSKDDLQSNGGATVAVFAVDKQGYMSDPDIVELTADGSYIPINWVGSGYDSENDLICWDRLSVLPSDEEIAAKGVYGWDNAASYVIHAARKGTYEDFAVWTMTPYTFDESGKQIGIEDGFMPVSLYFADLTMLQEQDVPAGEYWISITGGEQWNSDTYAFWDIFPVTNKGIQISDTVAVPTLTNGKNDDSSYYWTWDIPDGAAGTLYRVCDKDGNVIDKSKCIPGHESYGWSGEDLTKYGTHATMSVCAVYPDGSISNWSDPVMAGAHTYGEPTWKWSTDLTSATASFKCSECGDVKTVKATISKSSDGKTLIATADFGGKTYTNSVIAAPAKPTVKIATAFGGRTVTFNCTDADADIYYNFGSSAITTSCKHVKAGGTIFLDEPMTGNKAAVFFKAYKNGTWSPVGKWGVLNVQIAKPLIVQSGKKADNKFKVYTQTKNSYIIYTLDGSVPSINEGTQQLKVKNGRIIWSTSGIVNIPKGRTLKAIAIRNGLVTSDLMTYTNK